MKENKKDTIATDVIRQAKRQAKMWFTAWLLTMAALVFTNLAWAVTIL